MSDAVAHTLDGCEVQPLGEELNPEREELLVDMDVVRERGLEIINTTAYIAITGTKHEGIQHYMLCYMYSKKKFFCLLFNQKNITVVKNIFSWSNKAEISYR